MRRLTLLAAIVLALPALALDWKVGPSCSLLEVKPGDLHPVQLAPGLGVQGGVDLGNWNVELAFFGSLNAIDGSTVGAASFAPFVCYEPYGACLGPVFDAANSAGEGFLQGRWSWRQSFGVVFSLSWDALTKLHLATGMAQ